MEPSLIISAIGFFTIIGLGMFMSWYSNRPKK